MIKAIIFDCFGVLATEAWLPFKAQHFGQDPKRFEQATELAQQANSGLISQSDFLRGVGRLVDLDPAEVEQQIAHNVPNEPLFNYIQDLKSQYKIGLLSNIAGDYLRQMFTPKHLALFDEIVLSYDVGAVKPDPRAFEITAERLGIGLAEGVLIDDQERNVAGAQATGMAAILYQDVEQLRAELEPLLKH